MIRRPRVGLAVGLTGLLVASLLLPATAFAVVPTAVDDAYSMNEDDVLTVGPSGVLTNDGDVPTAATYNDDVSTGVVSPWGGDGSFTYTPPADFFGMVTFTYFASNSDGMSADPATVRITVTSVNDPPSGTLDNNPITVNEDAGPQSDPGRVGSPSPGPSNEGQTVSFMLAVGTPALFSAGPAINSAGTLTFTPAPNAFGSSSVSVTIRDSASATTPLGSFSINVNSVNDPPTLTLGPDVNVLQNSGNATFAGWLVDLGPGPSNESTQTVTLNVVAGTTSLFATQPAINATTGDLTFRPATNRSGNSKVTVTATDNGGGDDSTVDAFNISVGNVNDPPTANNDVRTVEAGTSTSLNVLSNDTALPDTGETLTIVSTTTPAHGAVLTTGGGSGLTYTPVARYIGGDSFTYTISDGNGGFDTATVSVTVSDTIFPLIGQPSVRFVTNTQIGSTTGTVRINWPAATDGGSGIASYSVRQSTNGGAFTTIVASTTGLFADRAIPVATNVAFQVVARDRASNATPSLATATTSIARYQETTSLSRYSGTWKTVLSSTASNGQLRYSLAKGATVTFTFVGRSVALISPRGPTRGSAQISVDGVLIATVSLFRTTSEARRVVFSKAWPDTGPHTMFVKVLGTLGHARFDVDAFQALR